MKSIDNLRDYVLTAPSICSTTRAILVGYIDAIEREFEQYAVAEIDALPMTDENMAAAGWVRLPVDVDGVPIHVGDVMEWPYDNGEFRVNGIGGNTLFYIDKDSGECEWTPAGDKRHHHAPTVEDVLREFAQEMNENMGMYTSEAIDADEWRDADGKTIAEYAAKLRLAGDE